MGYAKSINFGPSHNIKFQKTIKRYKILGKIIDCVWPAPRILYQWNSFLKFYVMGRTKIDLFGIAHVKVEFIPVLKIYTIRILGRFVWSMHFVQCELYINKYTINVRVEFIFSASLVDMVFGFAFHNKFREYR